jgi:hypothetical protein
MNETPVLSVEKIEIVTTILEPSKIHSAIAAPIQLAPPKQYEEYWRLTNAFTDYNEVGFINTLRICIEFINKHKDEKYSALKNTNLQEEVDTCLGYAPEIEKNQEKLIKLNRQLQEEKR